ncbi:MAG: PAS domain S-box protein [Planctomycetota bacterium]|nr:MAG: PAS domain S-box protein [Planctomycetota bacterium]
MEKERTDTLQETAEFVVGIGASAGGLDALSAFFSKLPARPGLAFVVVQHLGAEGEQLLVDALARATKMPVHPIAGKTALEPNCVFVAPGGAKVELAKGHLRLKKASGDDKQPTSIDHFFYSLADAKQSAAMGILFSGGGSDGSLGLKAIGDAGGMTMVQSPESASRDAMPRNAIATGAVDHVLPPQDIPRELTAYVQHLRKASLNGRLEELREKIAEAVPAVAEILKKRTNQDFLHYKTSTLVRRITRRMQVLRTTSIDQYVQRLRRDEQEQDALFRDLLIGVTAFFRDPEAFAELADEVIGEVLRRASESEPVRIWVPACATGEEAYTIAILCREQMETLGVSPQVQIFATDIDTRALEVARRGAYPVGIAEELSPERLKRFFVKRGRRYEVAREIRELCLFSPQNLISDPPLSRMDLISCRNLLIYLGPHLQKKLVPLFHYALRPGGYLFLGPSENLSSHRELFQPISAEHRISQRKSVPEGSDESPPGREQHDARRGADGSGNGKMDLEKLGARIVLDEFAPEWAIVNEDAQIVALSAEAGKYLQLTQGRFQNNVIKMARTGLRVGLRAALSEARRSHRRVEHENVSIRSENGIQRMMLTVQPMPEAGEDSGLFMIVFHQLGSALAQEEVSSAPTADDTTATIDHLERELASTREDLESSIRELESANEELKSSNEELVSMNEELESANEELEASKEEIRSGTDALARTKSDLENLLRSTGIATLFLDDELTIQSFTPAVTEIYNLIESDIGRPIWHQTHRAVKMPPLPDVVAIRSSHEPIDDILETTDGRFFTRRVLPYRTLEGKHEGIVITFTDVSSVQDAMHRLERRERQTAVLAELGRAALVCDDLESLFDEAVRQVAETLDNEYCKLLKLLPGSNEVLLAAGIGWKPGLVGKLTLDKNLESQAGYTLQADGPVIVEDLRTDSRFRGLQLLTDHGVVSGMSVTVGPRDRPWGILGTHTERRKDFTIDDANFVQAVANILWETIASDFDEQRFRALVEASAQIVWWTNDVGEIVEDSPSWREFTGQSFDEFKGFGWQNMLHEDDRESANLLWRHCVATRSPYEIEYRLRHRSGQWRWTLARGVPLVESDGTLRGWVGLNADITVRKKAEQAVRESEQFLRRTLNGAIAYTGVCERDGTFIFGNKSGLDSGGVTEKDVVGKPFHETVWWQHDEKVREQIADAIRRAAEGETARLQTTYWCVGDEIRMIDFQAAPMRNDAGEIPHLVVSGFDVTERALFEQQLIEADRHKDEFIALLAHELRNPLAPIRNAAQVFEIMDLQDETLIEMRDIIKRQVEHMARLLDDLLDVSRIARGKVQLRREPVELGELVRTAAEDLRGTFNERNVSLDVRLPEGPLVADADPTRISQCVGNLLHNAFKFTEDGGSITIKLTRSGDNAVIGVRDTGIGMEREFLEHLFQPFRQADRSLHRSPGGLGLGLAMVRGLLELHGGGVEANSEGPGKGSEFVIRLPLETSS